MDKKILSAAIAGVIAGSMAFAANADTTVYGQVNMSVGKVENTISGQPAFGVDSFQVRSHASRLGFKGSEDLGNGLKANFQLEYETDQDYGTGQNGSTINLGRRNMWVGLSGDSWGEVRVGRHDTPLKWAQGGFDQFNDTDADIKGALSISQGEERVDNVIAYISPNFSGFTIVGAAIAGEATKAQEACASASSCYDGTGLADIWSLAGAYKNGPLFASLAYNAYNPGNSFVNTEKDSMWRGVATYKIGDGQIGGLYESTNYESGAGDHNAWGISANYMIGSIVPKFQYMKGKTDGVGGASDRETDQWTLGADYNFSKRTSAYVMYTSGTDDRAGAGDHDYTFAGVGMLHKF